MIRGDETSSRNVLRVFAAPARVDSTSEALLADEIFSVASEAKSEG